MPASAKIRVEVYIPDRQRDPSYRKTLDWIADEFTYLKAGGASVIEGIDGRYLSPRTESTIYDRVSVIYSDFPSDWSNIDERLTVLRYLEELGQFAETVLWREETVLVVAYAVFHVKREASHRC